MFLRALIPAAKPIRQFPKPVETGCVVSCGDDEVRLMPGEPLERGMALLKMKEESRQEKRDMETIYNLEYFHKINPWSRECDLCGKNLYHLEDENYTAERKGIRAMVELICHRSIYSPHYYDTLDNGAGI